jgi:antitoxin HicB
MRLTPAQELGTVVGMNIGSDFDEFLEEEGLLAEVEATAIKRVLVYQIEKAMEARDISRGALARMMGTSRSSVNRLLDPKNISVTLLSMVNVALALGRKLTIQLG